MVILAWIGGISAVLGFLGTITGFFGGIQGHFHHNAQLDSQMAIAQTQFRQGDYQASVQSYADILGADSLYRPALDRQLQATMLWVENVHVYLKDGEDPGPAVTAQLDRIMAILDAGLARAKGAQAADVQAHIGWAHWLNQHIAEREFPPNAAAEQNFRAALATDPANVYANAMLGNWLLQNGGSVADSVQHFNTAVATGNARPFVRTLQIDGLKESDQAGSRAALVKAVNEMRKGGEPIDEDNRYDVLTFCFNPTLTNHTELAESLLAVPPDDVWQTYLWLDDKPDSDDHTLVHDFIQANLFELTGKRQESLTAFRHLQQALKNQGSTMEEPVNAAIKRLSSN
jgi:tetratricopeptide (TPR) repeat protein